MDQYNKIVLEAPEDQAKYFTKITAEDRKKVEAWLEKMVEAWLAKQAVAPRWAERFLYIVQEAVQGVDYDYWIANLEPSVKDGKIYYAKGEVVGGDFSCNQYDKMAKEYAPERGSRLASVYELFMWYALRIANGLWTFEYVAHYSSGAGNYVGMREKSGERNVGGYEDGQGNTYKIVTFKYGFAFVGGSYIFDGYRYPVARIFNSDYADPRYIQELGSPVVVLTK